MNKVIGFLEQLASNPDFKLQGIDIESLLENDDFDSEVKAAILAGDQSAIEMILNARSKIVCLLVPADDDEDESEDDSEEEESESIRVA